MRYIVDHDLHIHSFLSLCSGDSEQTTENILQYAKINGLSKICLTNHFWDSDIPGANKFYQPQNLCYLKQALPLPESDGIHFYFGCEGEMDKNAVVGILPDKYDSFDFIIIPTTHLHMKGMTINDVDFESETRRSALYIERLMQFLSQDYPYHKMGIAHLTCDLIAGAHHLNSSRVRILEGISDQAFTTVFQKAAEVGVGIEINVSNESYTSQDEALIRPLQIAKSCGCKFYFGSDAHHLAQFEHFKERAETMVDLLSLEESDKFNPFH